MTAAIDLFGFKFDATLASVVEVFIEAHVMLSVINLIKRS
jgi:ACR3 family arsenite efflux pump ArsB